MVIEDTLFVLLRRVSPEIVMENWVKSLRNPSSCTQKPLCLLPDEKSFYTSLQNQFQC